jgi:solute carrier family 6 amino acid transporter-like protein 5/7/9/14
MDTLTSMLGGLTIYAILGNLAANSGKEVKDVVSDSFGLAFITYPEAIAKIRNAMSDAWILPQVR